MNRRDAIKQTALLMGCAVSLPAIASIMSGCQPSKEPDWIPEFFSPEQGELLAQLCDRIVPATDTPGAIDVFAHRYIDLMLKSCYPAPAQETFLLGLNQLEGRCNELHQRRFVDCGPEEQDALLTEFAQRAADERAGGSNADPLPFFFALKELCIVGYLTSEEVSTKLLAYDPIPQQYQGCVSIEEASGGRQWTLL